MKDFDIETTLFNTKKALDCLGYLVFLGCENYDADPPDKDFWYGLYIILRSINADVKGTYDELIGEEKEDPGKNDLEKESEAKT